MRKLETINKEEWCIYCDDCAKLIDGDMNICWACNKELCINCQSGFIPFQHVMRVLCRECLSKGINLIDRLDKMEGNFTEKYEVLLREWEDKINVN